MAVGGADRPGDEFEFFRNEGEMLPFQAEYPVVARKCDRYEMSESSCDNVTVAGHMSVIFFRCSQYPGDFSCHTGFFCDYCDHAFNYLLVYIGGPDFPHRVFYS